MCEEGMQKTSILDLTVQYLWHGMPATLLLDHQFLYQKFYAIVTEII